MFTLICSAGLKNTTRNKKRILQKTIMKNFFLLLPGLIICIALVNSCNKKNDISPFPGSDSENAAERISASPSYRGLYVDNFDDMLGDTSKENTLLRWCKKYKIKVIGLYDLNTILQNHVVVVLILKVFALCFSSERPTNERPAAGL